ncbi:unnamed protein product [Urochloa humidicola]
MAASQQPPNREGDLRMPPPRCLPAGSVSSKHFPSSKTDSPSLLNTGDTNKTFNLRKSIAWNPAFFTEQGVLDNSELSLLAGSQLKPNASPRSPFCRSGRSATACVLKESPDNLHRKLPAKYEKQGRKLFSSAKTPQRDQLREPTETKNDKASSTSIQKCIPRVPSGSLYPY